MKSAVSQAPVRYDGTREFFVDPSKVRVKLDIYCSNTAVYTGVPRELTPWANWTDQSHWRNSLKTHLLLINPPFGKTLALRANADRSSSSSVVHKHSQTSQARKHTNDSLETRLQR